jgi:hypothetical protein
VAQDGTDVEAEPVVTSLMVAAGLSQLPSMDWTLAMATETLTHVYIQMWKVSEQHSH